MGKNKKHNNGASAINTSNEYVNTTTTYKQEKLEEAEKDLNVQRADILAPEDKENMANQCYHFNDACELGTCTSILSKYAVFYCNRWFFCIYNRDDNKVSSIIPLGMLTSAENNRFLMYKNRLENNQRIARLNTMIAKGEVIK